MAVTKFAMNEASRWRGPGEGHLCCTARSVRMSATTDTTGTFQMPQTMNKIMVDVPTMASCTFTLKVKTADVGASYRAVKADLDGNAYPRSSYTGNEILNFLVPHGSQVVLTGSGGNFVLQPWR